MAMAGAMFAMLNSRKEYTLVDAMLYCDYCAKSAVLMMDAGQTSAEDRERTLAGLDGVFDDLAWGEQHAILGAAVEALRSTPAVEVAPHSSGQ